MVIVAILTVRRAELAAFRAFESAAAAIMREHGGSIERSVVVDEGDAHLFTEIHFVRFESRAGFDAYGESEALARERHLRDRSVVATRLYVGEDGPVYS